MEYSDSLWKRFVDASEIALQVIAVLDEIRHINALHL